MLAVLEYQEINAHLRTNTTGFVNWFSFFLTFSIVAAIAFLVTDHRKGLRGLALQYGVPIACLMCTNRHSNCLTVSDAMSVNRRS